MILGAGAVLQRVRTLSETCENHRKIAPRALPERDARKHSRSNRFFSANGLRKGHPSVSETSSRHPWGALGSLRGVPGVALGRPGELPGTPRHALKTRRGRPQGPRQPRKGPGSDFASILGAPGRVPGAILGRFGHRFSGRVARDLQAIYQAKIQATGKNAGNCMTVQASS